MVGLFIDHYLILGLPSGEEGTKIPEKEVTKAYRLKALELHPDKRAHEPNAVTDFQNLQVSYHILKDEITRKAFDKELILRLKQQKRQREYSTRTRMMHDDVEERKRKRRMSDLDENWVNGLITELHGRRMSDVEESKRRMMDDLEENEHGRTMSDVKVRKHTFAYAFYPTAFNSP